MKAAQTSEEIPRPTGPAFAGIVSAGLGFATLGVLATLAEASSGVADWLAFSDRVGELSGKTLIAIGVYFLSWIALGLLWRRSSPSIRGVVAVSALLIGIGLIGTFPPFFHSFG